MHKIPYLIAICDHNATLEALFLKYGATAEINHALALCSHLLDELERPQYNSVYFERQLAELNHRIAHMPTIIRYRGITAKITPCNHGYHCLVMDQSGNDIDWFVNTNDLSIAVADTERQLDRAIMYFRGFITMTDFFKRMEEN